MKYKKYLLLIPSLLAILIAFGNSISTSNAFSLNVNGEGLGLGLYTKKIPSSLKNSESSLATIGDRTYTADELFSKSYDTAIPYGIIEKGDWFYGKNDEVAQNVELTKDQKDRLTDQGKRSKQLSSNFNGILILLNNTTTSIGQWLSGLIRALSASLFSNDFVCNPDSNNKFCINLVGVVGGENDADKSGLLSTLGTGIFVPLQVIAFALVGMWILYTALIKKEFRTSLSGALWALFALLLGMIVIYNPYTFTRFPQQVNGAVGDCLMGAITGTGCHLTGGSGTPSSNSICESSAVDAGSGGNSLALKINGLTCGVTKAFTINNWAYQQFGYNIDELWTKDPPAGYDVYPAKKLQGKPEDYCVNMHSQSSPADSGNSPKMTSVQRCNIALAYLANKTQGDYGNTATMQQIILTAAKDDTMWNAFTGQAGRTAFGGIWANLGILIAAIAFIPVTVYAHAYSLTSTIMLAFAPVFFLFGLHPGRGKKIFLGWLETEVSYILKYLASALLTIVMIIIYGATLAKMNAFSAFVAIIILDFTFIMYRKELVNLIGTVNMGGVKVSNKASEALSKMHNNVSQYAQAGLGGAVGGAMLAGSMARNGELSGGAAQVLSEIGKGVGGGLGMEARRGNGVVATATRQFKATNDQLSNARKKALQQKAEKQATANRNFDNKKANILDSTKDSEVTNKLNHAGLGNLATDMQETKDKIAKLNGSANKGQLAKLETELNMKVGHNIQLANAIDKTGSLDSALNLVGNNENDRAINRTSTSVDNLVTKLDKLHSMNAISDSQYKEYSDIARNIQEKSMSDVNIKFQDDLNKANVNGQIDPALYHKAWDTHQQGQAMVSEELNKLHASAEKAIDIAASQTVAGNTNLADSRSLQNALHQFETVGERTKDTVINNPTPINRVEHETVIIPDSEARKVLDNGGKRKLPPRPHK